MFIQAVDIEECIVLQDWVRIFSESETYVVGGTIRDVILDKGISDIDIVVKGITFKEIESFAVSHELKAVWLDKTNGIVRVLPHDNHWHLDIVFYYDTIQTDLERRDFTINSMAISLKDFLAGNDNILDPFNGKKDLDNKIISADSDSVFKDDPIRMLRAVRFSGTLGFTIDEYTESLIKRDAHLIKGESGERIREELLVIFGLTNSSYYFEKLMEYGVLSEIIPELIPMLTTDQPDEQQWNVFLHSIYSMDAFDYLIRYGAWSHTNPNVRDEIIYDEEIKSHFEETVSYGSNRRILVKVAALLHDVSKPETRIETENGKIRFYGHPKLGAEKSKEILKRLRFSAKEIEVVCKIVDHHLHPVQLTQEKALPGKPFIPPTKKALYRYCRDLDNEAIDTAYFSLADDLAAFGDKLDLTNWLWHANITNCIIGSMRQLKEQPLPKLIDGNDLLRSGIKNGPEIGVLLENIKVLQAEGTINNREQALEYINKYIEQGQNET